MIRLISFEFWLDDRATELQQKMPKNTSRPPGSTRFRDESPRESVDATRFGMETPPRDPTPFDKQPDRTITSTKPESGFASSSHQPPPPPKTQVGRKRPESRPEDVKADVWEKTEMERIKERYVLYF